MSTPVERVFGAWKNVTRGFVEVNMEVDAPNEGQVWRRRTASETVPAMESANEPSKRPSNSMRRGRLRAAHEAAEHRVEALDHRALRLRVDETRFEAVARQRVGFART